MTPEQKFKRLISDQRLKADTRRAISWAADKIAALTSANQTLVQAVDSYKAGDEDLSKAAKHWKDEAAQYLQRAIKAEENFQELASNQKDIIGARDAALAHNLILETCIQSMALHIRALIRESGKGK